MSSKALGLTAYYGVKIANWFNNKLKIEWGAQIRSYVLDDRRVKDHRTNFTVNDPSKVLDGELDGFLKAYLMEFGKN